jgi:16S rRNA (cytosine967-C5)-methyltransferase
MAISPARVEAFDILLRSTRDAAWAGELLNAPRMDKLSREDRALAHELVMRTLRWRSALDARLAPFCSKPLAKLDVEVLTALRLGACQLLQLERIPAHAAVHESVELVKRAGKRSAAPLANAVLRKLSSSGPHLPAVGKCGDEAEDCSAASLSAKFAHPAWLIARWIDTYGSIAARAICEAGQQQPQPALRLGADSAAADAALAADGIVTSPGRLLRSARRLVSGDLAHSAALHEGRVAIQDEGSQMVAALVGRGAHGTILDCCAAPGGKTLALRRRNPQAAITAVELHPHRARLLTERTAGANIEVRCGDLRGMEFLAPFDRVLADVPCSGTGTLAAHPEIKWRLRPEEIAGLQDSQVSILLAAAAALAPGGRLIYSTCSLEPEECEQVVARVLAAVPALRLIPCAQRLAELHEAGELAWPEPAGLLRGEFLRTLPGVHPCDGFFAAAITRA